MNSPTSSRRSSVANCSHQSSASYSLAVVTAHTFDLVGATAVGMRGAYLNRHDNRFGGWPQRPDLVVEDATELAGELVES